MSRRAIKIVITLVVIATLIGAAIGLYFYHNHGPIVGRVKFGEFYYLDEIRPTARFKGATMSKESYFHIDADGKTGRFYLKDLEATTAPIEFIVTDYHENNHQTTFDLEYIIGNGNDTKIQYLTAISTDDKICIKTVEKHDVRIIQQKYDETDSIEYEVETLIFKLTQEAAQWDAESKLL